MSLTSSLESASRIPSSTGSTSSLSACSSPILDFSRHSPVLIRGDLPPPSGELTKRWRVTYRLIVAQEITVERETTHLAKMTLRKPLEKTASHEFEMTFRGTLSEPLKYSVQPVQSGARAPRISYDQDSNTMILWVDSKCVEGSVRFEEVADSSKTDAKLAEEIYNTCKRSVKVQTALDLKPGTREGVYFEKVVIPRLVHSRKEALKVAATRPGEVAIISSKERSMQFPGYGKVSLRILPDGSTYIILPHITPCEGGLKKVKYGILISPEGDTVSVQMICKLQKVKVIGGGVCELRKEYHHRFIKSFDIASRLPPHPNISRPTAMIPHPTKIYEMIIPECEGELELFLKYWQDLFHKVSSNRSEGKSCEEDSISNIKVAFGYLREITSAMKHIYDSGYLYCDLKPANIMFKRLDEGSSITQLIDFDLFTARGGPLELGGTPLYIPPGATHNSLATELYALGRVIRYKPLPGHPDKPSFNDLFKALEAIEGAQGNKVLERIIHGVRFQLFQLSERLISGTISSYDEVVHELESIEAQFTAKIGSGSGAPSTHTSAVSKS